MNPSPQLDPWQERIAQQARAFAWPPTPDIAGRVATRMAAARPTPQSSRRLRPAWALGLAVLLLGAILAASPARAALVRFVQVGLVRIFERQGETPLLPPQSQLTPQPSLLDQIAGELPLAEAQRAARAPLRGPAGAGPPARAFYQFFGGPVITLAWLDAEGAPALILQQLGGDAILWKMEPVDLVETSVHGAPALWTEGPYLTEFQSGNVEQRRLVEGRALIWEEGGVTWRLESRLSLEEAVRVAESLQPLQGSEEATP